jgi:hypothetical protein
LQLAAVVLSVGLAPFIKADRGVVRTLRDDTWEGTMSGLVLMAQGRSWSLELKLASWKCGVQNERTLIPFAKDPYVPAPKSAFAPPPHAPQATLSLRAADVRIKELEVDLRHYQDCAQRAEEREQRAESWLARIHKDVEQRVFGKKGERHAS